MKTILFSMTAALVVLVLSLFRLWKNEKTLILREAKFRTLFERSGDAVILIDPENGFLDGNPEALQMFAVPTIEQFCRLSLKDLSSEYPYNDTFPGKFRGIDLSATLKDGRDFFECILKDITGREFPATLLFAVMELEGKILIQGTVRDITVEKKTEQLLRESNERLESAVLVAKDGLWDWDIRTGNIYPDHRYLSLVGGESDEVSMTLKEWKKRVHPDDIGKVEKAFTRYLDGRASAYEVEFRYLKKDETWMLMMARGKIVAYDDEGSPARFVGIHSDISELKRTEKELSRTRKMDAVSQLAGGVAHDFNNLLGIISGNLELLSMHTGPDEKNNKWILAAQNAVTRVNDLTRQLLSFSRRQAGHVSVNNINRVIKGMKNLIGRSIGPEVVVEYNFDDTLWLTRIDPGDFEDALFNMVLNARDVMPGGGVLTIETSNYELYAVNGSAIPGAEPGQYVRLAVNDSGTGIPADHIDRIFEPFFTTKHKGKGIGLGLSMVFGFVKRSGGYINVNSEPGFGSTFRLYLPRVRGSEEETEKAYDSSADLPLGRETILVVDDEVELLELARTTLESFGYRVLTVSDGNQALATLAEDSSIDLMFSDVVMPGGINGYELSKEAAVLYPDLKILLTSGYTEKQISSSARLLKKPYKQPELVHRIRDLLDENNKTSTQAKSRYASAIKWSDAYSLGIDSLDADHQVLLELLNRGRNNLDRGGEEELRKILDELQNYSRIHFRREELVMEVSGFPQLRNHSQVHQLLLRDVKEKVKKLDDGELSARELTEFIGKWLINHIQIMDSAIVPYCKGKTETIEQALLKAGSEGHL